jgi:putative ABC transport system ATP-binding protein
MSPDPLLASEVDQRPALEVNDLKFIWRRTGFALELPRLDVRRGERLFIHGPSGSGKTTFLNLISGILRPSEGSIRVAGEDITRLSSARRDKFRARHMGVVFQQLNLIPFLRVSDNIALQARFSGQGGPTLREEMEKLLRAMGLDLQLMEERADQLSVGQQQRVALARAMIHRPDLLIADEPTSALDQDNRDSFIELMNRLSADFGTAVLFVSHDRSLAPHFHRQTDIRDLLGGRQ